MIKKNYEIWVGSYHLGQGYTPPNEPEKVGEVEATSFKIACYIYELESELKSLKNRMDENDTYIEDVNFGRLCYDPKTNSNSWMGKYYKTKEEAYKSFYK